MTFGSTEVRLAIKPSEADLEGHECCEDPECHRLIKAASSAKQEELSRHFTRLFDASVTSPAMARSEVNTRGKHGVTALMLAADRGNDQGVRGLLRLGADVMAHTKAGCTALTMAAGEGRYQAAADLFAQGFEDHNSDVCSFTSVEQKRAAMRKLANWTEDPYPTGGVTALYRAAQVLLPLPDANARPMHMPNAHAQCALHAQYMYAKRIELPGLALCVCVARAATSMWRSCSSPTTRRSTRSDRTPTARR